jgi:hypothetical protein
MSRKGVIQKRLRELRLEYINIRKSDPKKAREIAKEIHRLNDELLK